MFHAFLIVLVGGLLTRARGAADLPFTYQNPLNFSYDYYDGTKQQSITELRDPAIIRDGDTFYIVFTRIPSVRLFPLLASSRLNNYYARYRQESELG
jgi:hypothetical protein